MGSEGGNGMIVCIWNKDASRCGLKNEDVVWHRKNEWENKMGDI